MLSAEAGPAPWLRELKRPVLLLLSPVCASGPPQASGQEVLRSLPRRAEGVGQWVRPPGPLQSPRCCLPTGSCRPTLLPPGKGGAGGASGQTTGPAAPPSEPFTSPNRQSLETWLKISLTAKLSLKPLVSAPLEMGHRVKIENLNQLVFLSFVQLCCEVQSPRQILMFEETQVSLLGGFFRMKLATFH